MPKAFTWREIVTMRAKKWILGPDGEARPMPPEESLAADAGTGSDGWGPPEVETPGAGPARGFGPDPSTLAVVVEAPQAASLPDESPPLGEPEEGVAVNGPVVEVRVKPKSRRKAAPKPQTNRVLLAPAIIHAFFAHASHHPNHEVGAVALGRIVGKDLILEKLHVLPAIGTQTTIDFPPAEILRAKRGAEPGQLVAGWFHSHPRLGCFMSTTDVTFQSQSQTLFPDWTALVMDPFNERGVAFRCYRVQRGRAVVVKHDFLVAP